MHTNNEMFLSGGVGIFCFLFHLVSETSRINLQPE